MCGLSTCRDSNAFLPIGLLTAGAVLVFAGMTRSVGFSFAGITAPRSSRSCIGCCFFGTYAAPHVGKRDTIFVFDRTFRLVTGHEGLPIRAVLPSRSPSDHDARCTAVFGGKSERFEYAVTSQRVQADLVSVCDADGTVQFGMVILNRAGHAPVSSAHL